MDSQNMPVYVIVLLAWISPLKQVDGSRIIFNASSPVVRPLLTRTLTLGCSLQDTASSSTLIGRSLTSRPANAKFITSIYVFHNDVDVATVSEHIPAKSLTSKSNLAVTGGIPGPKGEMGILTLDMIYPEESDAGNYSCKITSIDEDGHQMTYQTSVDIDIITPTITDIVRHIHEQDLEADKAKQQAIDTKEEIDQNKAEIEALKAHNSAQDLKVATLESENTNLRAQFAESRHIESGVVRCASLGWGGRHPQSDTQTVAFKTAYKSPPTVHISLLDIGINKEYHAFFKVTLDNVDSQGFTVTCTVRDPSYVVDNIDVSWLSL